MPCGRLWTRDLQVAANEHVGPVRSTKATAAAASPRADTLIREDSDRVRNLQRSLDRPTAGRTMPPSPNRAGAPAGLFETKRARTLRSAGAAVRQAPDRAIIDEPGEQDPKTLWYRVAGPARLEQLRAPVASRGPPLSLSPPSSLLGSRAEVEELPASRYSCRQDRAG